MTTKLILLIALFTTVLRRPGGDVCRCGRRMLECPIERDGYPVWCCYCETKECA